MADSEPVQCPGADAGVGTEIAADLGDHAGTMGICVDMPNRRLSYPAGRRSPGAGGAISTGHGELRRRSDPQARGALQPGAIRTVAEPLP